MGSDVRQFPDDAFEEATPAFAPPGFGGRPSFAPAVRQAYSNRNVTYINRASR